MNRGIIVTTPFDFDGMNLRLKGDFDPVALRQYLLYWDKIDWPDNNIIGFGDGSPEIAFLKAAGVLERSKINMAGMGNVGNAMIRMQHAAFLTRNHDEPGAWSLAQQATQLTAPSEGTVESRFIEVELYSAIPIPTGEIALEDVLNFKVKRRDELLRFRAVMDDLYQQTIAAADLPRARIQALEQVDQAMQDLHKVFGETFSSRLISSLKVELNVPALAGMAAVGGVAATTFGLPIAAGAALGAATAAVKFDFKLGRKSITVPPELRDYAYLHSIHRELR